ncbi:MAG: hypothetical protein R2862_13260, partial [Thermoanaerobaculia bacterium]
LTTAVAAGEGTRVLLEGGRVLTAEPTARPRGTTIDVRSLFFNVPARRKFLKSRETELRRAVEVIEGYVLARPEVAFRTRSETRTLLEAQAQPDPHSRDALRRRIAEVFGETLAAGLSAIGDGARGPVHGFVGSPATARGTRRSFVFVNRRLVRDRAVLATFYRSVREEWRSDEFPALFLFLEIPPDEVDVNVHPQKAEVRFRDPRLMDRLGGELRKALARARGEEDAPLRVASTLPAAAFAWEGDGGAEELREGPATTPPGAGGGAAPDFAWTPAEPRTRFDPRLAELALAPLDREPIPLPLSGRGGETNRFRLLGQYKGALILLEGPDGLYLIDQHVAHERILYERFRQALAARAVASQRLLAPLQLELARSERGRLIELADDLEGAGYEVRELSEGVVAVTAMPAVLPLAEAEALLLELAGEDASAANLRVRLLDDLAASLACKAAVKMHDALAPEKLEAMVTELFRAEHPFACPHGRPVVLRLTDADLERRFGRR